mmetsp:Transcript_10129/g.31230  ORF Transcript_10129/g.31230 Transcript_10129/m.31230 type:complete len:210 (-) Transcript_10129:8-637(-)
MCGRGGARRPRLRRRVRRRGRGRRAFTDRHAVRGQLCGPAGAAARRRAGPRGAAADAAGARVVFRAARAVAVSPPRLPAACGRRPRRARDGRPRRPRALWTGRGVAAGRRGPGRPAPLGRRPGAGRAVLRRDSQLLPGPAGRRALRRLRGRAAQALADADGGLRAREIQERDSFSGHRVAGPHRVARARRGGRGRRPRRARGGVKLVVL